MARPKIESDKERVGVRLFIEDLELLRTVFPDNGYNEVVRNIVHKVCNKMRQQMSDRTAPIKIDSAITEITQELMK